MMLARQNEEPAPKEMFAAELNGGKGREIGKVNRRKRREDKRVYLSQHSPSAYFETWPGRVKAAAARLW